MPKRRLIRKMLYTYIISNYMILVNTVYNYNLLIYNEKVIKRSTHEANK